MGVGATRSLSTGCCCSHCSKIGIDGYHWSGIVGTRTDRHICINFNVPLSPKKLRGSLEPQRESHVNLVWKALMERINHGDVRIKQTTTTGWEEEQGERESCRWREGREANGVGMAVDHKNNFSWFRKLCGLPVDGWTKAAGNMESRFCSFPHPGH